MAIGTLGKEEMIATVMEMEAMASVLRVAAVPIRAANLIRWLMMVMVRGFLL